MTRRALLMTLAALALAAGLAGGLPRACIS
ncbi:MAG: hypothetical protein QOK40_1846 [Miltoncostaeaceae bacterium]|nr:hypothetical protein [Miltoncostaeaceae bacterium]